MCTTYVLYLKFINFGLVLKGFIEGLHNISYSCTHKPNSEFALAQFCLCKGYFLFTNLALLFFYLRNLQH